LIAYVAVSFCLLLGYNRFAGMRRDARWWEVAVDSIEEMGIGLVISALVLFLLAQIEFDMPLSEIVGKIVIASMTVAVGVSVGTAQLGGASGEGDDGGMEDDPVSEPAPDPDRPVSAFDRLGHLTLAFCGAVLFASNIGATLEIPRLGMEASSPRLLGLVALSLTIGAVILFFSDFRGSGQLLPRKSVAGIAVGLAGSYGAALAASAMMLWFFERLEGNAPFEAVSQIVVLAFPSTLGACAGRLLIQSQ
jgi:putative integral membrane protein (TIGR02587 family)